MLVRVFLISLVTFSAPAAAAGSAQVPEGSSLTLFTLGLAGLIIGRHAAIKRRDGGDDE